MTPPRFSEWLLRATIRDREVGESIRGDLYAEYRTVPRAWRWAWYTWHALLIGTRYLVARPSTPNQPPLRGASPGLAGVNVRQAIRYWRRRPGFTAITVCTLGLGTGVTAAIVAVVDHVILRALPYPDAHELVTVWNTYPAWRGHEVLDRLWDRIHLSYPEYRDWREGQRSFRAVAIYIDGRGHSDRHRRPGPDRVRGRIAVPLPHAGRPHAVWPDLLGKRGRGIGRPCRGREPWVLGRPAWERTRAV